MELHEIIFSRGAIRGTDEETMLKIMDARNCGWVHRNCHQMTEGGIGRLRAIMYLIRYEGYTQVCQFTTEMAMYSVNWMEFARDVQRAWEMMNAALIAGMP